MQFRVDPLYASRRSPVFGRNVVAASQPLAAQAGLAMLQQGGNAVDAALAAAIALTVVEPTGNGVGSDAFAMVWDGAALHGLNASGQSPAGWSPERFRGLAAMPEHGWESVTVPGAVSAWAALSRRFGALAFDRLFAPAVRYAEQGFHVTPIIAEQWRQGAATLAGQPGFAAAFLPYGRPPAAGEVFVNPPLAATLRAIAESGGEDFYRGRLAGRIAGFARQHGAALTEADLAAHECHWTGTVSQRFAGVDVHEMPPNGQGIAALMALGILAELGIEAAAPDSAEALHLQIEAMKLSFADSRAYVADPRFMTATSAADLLDPAYLARRARLVDPRRAGDFGPGAPRRGGTVYLAAADEQGMMVSFIQSNYHGFGSGVVVPGTGISLHNRGAGFTLREDHPNVVGPRKRPFHTIIPGFLMREGAPLASFGVMGAAMQAQGHVQMALRTALWGQDPQTALDAPRWRVLDGRTVAVEKAAGAEVLAALAERGHRIVTEVPGSRFGFGGGQIIQRIDGGYVAGSEPRKDGQAVAT